MSLKDLTHDAHKNAERQEFVKIMFSGNINPKLYATFLKNQHLNRFCWGFGKSNQERLLIGGTYGDVECLMCATGY
jgi:hypothetical protein